MQSSETKTKRTRKGVEETNASRVAVPAAASEEPTKARRRAVVKTPTVETTPSVKHRGAARKTAAPESERPSVETSAGAKGHFSPPITRDAIAALAYSYWEARGFQGGSPEDDWFRAERELQSR